MDFEVVQGDITNQRADVLVSAADTQLKMSGGVAGALKAEAGSPLKKEATQKAPIEVGEAVRTAAYELHAEHVIHVATREPGNEASEEIIRAGTKAALNLAENLGCESIVLPALAVSLVLNLQRVSCVSLRRSSRLNRKHSPR